MVIRSCLFLLSLLFLMQAQAGQAHQLQLVGYFGQWSIDEDPPYYLKRLVTNGSAARLDQLNYSQASVAGGRCSIANPKADLETVYDRKNSITGMADDPDIPFRGYFHQLKELKSRYPHLKILISLEGAATGFAADAQPENRSAFVRSCVDIFLRGHFANGINEPGIFDGIDVDWEYPQKEDAENFRQLLGEFRRQMNAVRTGLRLSIAVGPSPRMEPGTDFAAIAPLVEQIGIMNYDYNGPWSATTGFMAPLYPDPGHHSGNIDGSISDYANAGAPRDKLLMGLPFYGYEWTNVRASNHGLFQTGHGVEEDRPYRYIRSLVKPSAVYRDPHSQAPWIFDGMNFWTYDDPTSVTYKVQFAARQQLGGVMVWELSEDAADGELLRAADCALRHTALRC